MVYTSSDAHSWRNGVHSLCIAVFEVGLAQCSACRPCTVSSFHIQDMASEGPAARCDTRTLRLRRFHPVNLEFCERDLSQPCPILLLFYSQKKRGLACCCLTLPPPTTRHTDHGARIEKMSKATARFMQDFSEAPGKARRTSPA